MDTVTVTKKRYRDLEIQAELYQKVLKRGESEVFPIELYGKNRLKEFSRADIVTARAREKAKKLLRSK